MMKRTTKDTNGMKRAVQTLAVLALVALLAGCSLLPKGGQTAASAMRQANSIPGITAAYVEADGAYSGIVKENNIIVAITVKPGFQVPDPGKLVDFLIQLGWSANDNRPNTPQMFVSIDSPAPIDLAAAAKGAGWKSAESLPGAPPSIFIDFKEVQKRLGGWPGKVPATPAGMVVKDPASPDPSTP